MKDYSKEKEIEMTSPQDQQEEQEDELYADELSEEQDLSKSCVRPFTPRVTLAEWMKTAARDAGRLRQERGF